MIPALILGRKGSQGFPGKNTMLVLGKPLMAYPLIAAQELANFLNNFLEKYAPKYLGKLEDSASEKIMKYLNKL